MSGFAMNLFFLLRVLDSAGLLSEQKTSAQKATVKNVDATEIG